MIDHTIELTEEETDICVMLPDGREIILQYRLEGVTPSLDICLPVGKDVPVTCFRGQNLDPAETDPDRPHEHLCGQLVICL